jgi:Xaa-Pro aminopeptidase
MTMTDTELRLATVRADLAGLAADALVIGQEHNRRYLTGFTGSAGLVVVTADAALLLADSRYVEQAAREAAGFEVVKVPGRFQDTLGERLKALGVAKVAFEAEHVTVAELKRWQEGLPDLAFMPATGIVERQRAVKTPAELGAIRRAAALADAAMGHVMATVRPGQTEAEVAWAIERFLREQGAEGLAFPPIVAAGENGALPHHHPGQRVIAAGEPIVVDLGACLDGYNSDLTRTFSIGPARDADYGAVFAIVAGASAAAQAALRPGLTGLAADAVARDRIKAAGFGEQFGHSLGHGVGLNVHEGPRLSFVPPESELAAGNVVTVEPGIYLSGRFGVRIEDLVVIHDQGVEVLSQAPSLPVVNPGDRS